MVEGFRGCGDRETKQQVGHHPPSMRGEGILAIRRAETERGAQALIHDQRHCHTGQETRPPRAHARESPQQTIHRPPSKPSSIMQCRGHPRGIFAMQGNAHVRRNFFHSDLGRGAGTHQCFLSSGGSWREAKKRRLNAFGRLRGCVAGRDADGKVQQKISGTHCRSGAPWHASDRQPSPKPCSIRLRAG